MDITCPQCGYHRDIKEEKLPPLAQMATCPKCRHKFQFRELATPPADNLKAEKKAQAAPVENPKPTPQTALQKPAPQPTSPAKKNFWQGLQEIGQDHAEAEPESEPALAPKIFPPWEDVHTNGLLTGFTRTIVAVLFHPVHFFQNMRTGSGLLRPLIFYLLVMELQLILGLLLQGTSNVTVNQGNEMLAQLPITISPVQLLFLYPLLFTGSQFFAAGLNHLFLVLSGGAGKDFEATFRVACYGSAPFVFAAVFATLFPGGQVISAIWPLVCIVLGYKNVHAVSFLRATLAIFFQLFVAAALLLFVIQPLILSTM